MFTPLHVALAWFFCCSKSLCVLCFLKFFKVEEYMQFVVEGYLVCVCKLKEQCVFEFSFSSIFLMSSLLPFPFCIVPFQTTIVHSLFIPCCYFLMLFTNGLLLFVNVLLLIHQCLIVMNIIVICPCFVKCNIHYGCSLMLVTTQYQRFLLYNNVNHPFQVCF